MQGTSLVPVLQSPSRLWKSAAFSQFTRKGQRGYSLTDGRYRYTEWINPDGKVVYRDLYDMQEDPDETINIGARDENRELMASMAARLRENSTGSKRLQMQ